MTILILLPEVINLPAKARSLGTMREIKYSSGIHVFGNTSDRFVKDGYKADKSLKEMVGLAGQVPNLKGIELVEG